MLTQAALTPREALASATDNYAELYQWHDVGRIAPGYRADLVLLNADPTKDIASAKNISAVFLGGQQLDLTALLAWRPKEVPGASENKAGHSSKQALSSP